MLYCIRAQMTTALVLVRDNVTASGCFVGKIFLVM